MKTNAKRRDSENAEGRKERPVLMSGDMVRATLEDRKGQTRRIVKQQPKRCAVANCDDSWIWSGHHTSLAALLKLMRQQSPYGKVGDRLWVRETHKFNGTMAGPRVTYRANGDELFFKDAPDGPAWLADDDNWRPSIFMPRWAARLTLEIVGIRVERLQEISESDCLAEGIQSFTKDGILKKYWPSDPCEGDFKCTWVDLPRTAKEAYRALWEYINGPGSWAKNPWVWVIEFKRIQDSK